MSKPHQQTKLNPRAATLGAVAVGLTHRFFFSPRRVEFHGGCHNELVWKIIYFLDHKLFKIVLQRFKFEKKICDYLKFVLSRLFNEYISWFWLRSSSFPFYVFNLFYHIYLFHQYPYMKIFCKICQNFTLGPSLPNFTRSMRSGKFNDFFFVQLLT